jgi:hypothetical protein
MSMDTVIFEGKTLADMFADVYKNTESKRQQINQFVANLVKLIRTPEDAAVLGPVVQSFLEVNVKNDEHIVRLVQIAQRLATVNTKGVTGDILSEAEKAQLLSNIKDEFENVLSEQDELDATVRGIQK